ncbi:F-box/kelch-repeat protein At3g23880-like [Rhododendron vialii]|uniref:F-box/kelch-repeat protein At3g23880-like n=1 Tax=Rhododendron vialii TaxID=182163 RepID=UPI0026602398|nr:F-box/kelch-repeat protein At3g23880-like [Rhododendron vialii]
MSDFLPEDVVVHILSRLPTKSLIRFRSVSKLWNSLITSPNFINSQSLTNPKNSYDNLPLLKLRQCIVDDELFEHYKLVFIDTRDGDNTFDEYLEIPFPFNIRRHHIYDLVGYVKGLFCFFEPDNSFLWNPSIGESISLPKPGITKSGSLWKYVGFGFDSRTNDYKVVIITSLCGTKPSEVVDIHVYSLNAGSWKVSNGAGDSFPLGFRPQMSGSPSACLEGAIHFVIFAAKYRGNRSARLICSFDLGDEVFRTISLPGVFSDAMTEIKTIVFRGLLSVFCHDPNKFCSIWIMKEYGLVDSWYKYVKVDLIGGIKRVLGIRKNGHILLEGDGPRRGGKRRRDVPRHWELSSYDPWNKEITKLGIHGILGLFHVDIFEENLILLDKTDVPVSGRGGSRKRKDMQSQH